MGILGECRDGANLAVFRQVAVQRVATGDAKYVEFAYAEVTRQQALSETSVEVMGAQTVVRPPPVIQLAEAPVSLVVHQVSPKW